MESFSIHAAGLRTTGWCAGPPDAPAAVLLHGVPTSAALWSRLPEHLPNHRLIALDLPDHGGTVALDVPSFAAHLRWLEAALAALSVTGPVHLVGQDYGGLLAALHTARHGAAGRGIASLTLTSCPTGLLWLLPRITALPLLHRYFYQHHSGALYLHHGICDDAREGFLAIYGHVPGRSGLSESMRQTARHLSARALWPLTGQLAGVRTLCLWGDDDRFNPPLTARWTAARLGGRCVLVDGGRHYVPFGRPAAYAAALRSHWA